MADASEGAELDDNEDVVLISKDEQRFDVKAKVAKKSELLKENITHTNNEGPVPISNVEGRILEKVINYMKTHVEASMPEQELSNWDQSFVDVDQGTLFELILAANYLNIQDLLDLTCQTVANMIKGKSPQEIRDTFGVKNDFTKEEEEEVRRENKWAFE